MKLINVFGLCKQMPKTRKHGENLYGSFGKQTSLKVSEALSRKKKNLNKQYDLSSIKLFILNIDFSSAID